MNNPIPVDTFKHDADEVVQFVDDDECISYAFGGGFDQTGSNRVRKYKPGKDMGDPDDELECSDASARFSGE